MLARFVAGAEHTPASGYRPDSKAAFLRPSVSYWSVFGDNTKLMVG